MKKVSKKQQSSNRKVSKAKREFLEDFVDKFGYVYCCGCGTSNGRIDISHLVPIGYNKSLEATKENLTLHCRDCHLTWEHALEEAKKMNDYKRNLQTVKSLDESYYNLISNKNGKFKMGEV